MQFSRKFINQLLLALIIIFISLSYLIAQHPTNNFDLEVSLLVQKVHFDALDKFMLAISIFGEIPYSLISVLLVAGVFFRYKFKLEALFVTFILLSGLVILLVKNLIDRPRPTEFYVRLVEINRFKSYPSGHVLSYVLFFGFIIVLMHQLTAIPEKTRKILTRISYFLIVMIPISRIYLGAHWFTDTLGGFLLGLICLILLSYAYLKKKRGQNIPSRPRHLN